MRWFVVCTAKKCFYGDQIRQNVTGGVHGTIEDKRVA